MRELTTPQNVSSDRVQSNYADHRGGAAFHAPELGELKAPRESSIQEQHKAPLALTNIATRAHVALSQLNTISLPESVQDLGEYKAMLNERIDLMMSLHNPSTQIELERVPANPREVLDTISSLDNYLTGLPAGFLTELANGPIRRVGDAKVSWVDSETMNSQMGFEALGSASKFTKSIKMLGECPSAAEVVRHVAEHGTVPEVLSILTHERTHIDQNKSAGFLRTWGMVATGGGLFALGITGMFASGGVVGALYYPSLVAALSSFATPFLFRERDADEKYLAHEVHAFENAASVTCNFSDRMGIHDDKGRIFADIPRDTPRDQLMVKTYDTLRALRLLGVQQKTIIEAIRDSSFDRNTNTLTHLEDLLATTREQTGLTDEHLFQRTIKALDARFEIERAITQGYAKCVARAYTERRDTANG